MKAQIAGKAHDDGKPAVWTPPYRLRIGLLAPPNQRQDPRLEPGAYISRGLCLYRVASRSQSQLELENAYSLAVTATTASDVLANYQLEKEWEG